MSSAQAARAGDAAGEALRAADRARCADKREKEIIQTVTTLTCTRYAVVEERDKMEDALKKAEAKRERLVVDAAATGARLVDLRAWEKAVKLFFSALKNADASARVALCKDPEGEIEKLLETVEEATEQ